MLFVGYPSLCQVGAISLFWAPVTPKRIVTIVKVCIERTTCKLNEYDSVNNIDVYFLRSEEFRATDAMFTHAKSFQHNFRSHAHCSHGNSLQQMPIREAPKRLQFVTFHSVSGGLGRLATASERNG